MPKNQASTQGHLSVNGLDCVLDNKNSTQDAAQLSPKNPARVAWQPRYKPSTESPPVWYLASPVRNISGVASRQQAEDLVNITPTLSSAHTIPARVACRQQETDLVNITPPCHQPLQYQQKLPVLNMNKNY
jgi:hypothetical protein